MLAAPDAVAQADDDGETVDGAFLRAARASRAGTRAGRIVRVVRLARVLRLCRLWRAHAAAAARRSEAGTDATRRSRGDCEEIADEIAVSNRPKVAFDAASKTPPLKPLATLRERSDERGDGDPELSVAIVETVETTEGRGDILDVVVVKDDVKDEKARDRDAPGGDAPKPPQTKSSRRRASANAFPSSPPGA